MWWVVPLNETSYCSFCRILVWLRLNIKLPFNLVTWNCCIQAKTNIRGSSVVLWRKALASWTQCSFYSVQWLTVSGFRGLDFMYIGDTFQIPQSDVTFGIDWANFLVGWTREKSRSWILQRRSKAISEAGKNYFISVEICRERDETSTSNGLCSLTIAATFNICSFTESVR